MYSRLFTFVLLLAFITSASALSIDAPSTVPQNTSWGFSVALDSSWTKASVSIDGQHLLDIYPNGTTTPDPYNGGFVLKSFIYTPDSNSTTGQVAYVSHFGLASGTHRISATSDSSSDFADVIAFAPLTPADRNVLDSQIDSLEQNALAQEADINGLGARINRTALDANRSLLQGLEGVDERLDSMETQQSAMSVTLEEQAQKKSDPLTGFFDLAGGILVPLGFGLILIVVVALALGAVLLIRSKFSEPSNPYPKVDEYKLPDTRDSDEMAGALADGKGKWKMK